MSDHCVYNHLSAEISFGQRLLSVFSHVRKNRYSFGFFHESLDVVGLCFGHLFLFHFASLGAANKVSEGSILYIPQAEIAAFI